MNIEDLSEMVAAYAECLLWAGLAWDDMTENDDNPEPLDATYSTEDIDPTAWDSITRDCRDFAEANAADLADIDAGQAGHDLYLTRNGHGTGFWDRGNGAIGDRLADAARVYGESGEYTANGKVYIQ